MKILVVGLGNPILTDDGVGVKAAYQIERRLTTKERDQITVTEASVGGLRLMEMMISYNRVILIDAIMSRKGNSPGMVRRLTMNDLEEISPTQHSASAHDTTLVTAIQMGQKIGLSLPEEIVIYAIEVQNVLDFGEKPTPAIEQALPGLVDAVLEEIRRTDYAIM